jgi:hypothetical protein
VSRVFRNGYIRHALLPSFEKKAAHTGFRSGGRREEGEPGTNCGRPWESDLPGTGSELIADCTVHVDGRPVRSCITRVPLDRGASAEHADQDYERPDQLEQRQQWHEQGDILDRREPG